MSTLDPLFQSLQRRLRPEDVIEMILEVLADELTEPERTLLEKAAANSFKRGLHQFSAMLQDFQRPVPPARQANKAAELFHAVPRLSTEACSDPEQLAGLIEQLSKTLIKQVGDSDFKANRLNGEQRQQAGLELSKRRYNKLFRFLQRFERKLETYRLEQRKYAATRVAKAGLATLIRWEDFSDSPNAACFVAYYTAAKNRRSTYTNQSQAPAFDAIAAM
ncbi:hypothetical protein, partial [Chitinimonas sp. JJ19]|uniref:hypothetical protein n=1 Tax=Chitinimonas sp. JJ19 TaxID=3109352 RepID=UPI003001DE68